MSEVSPQVTHDLRRRVLREGHPEADVAFTGDDDPGALHLAVAEDVGQVVAVASVLPASCRHRPGRRSWRLRGMAVEPGRQGTGLGALLLDAVVARTRALGAEVLWAAGRDSALGFYQRHGWVVVGEGYPAADDLPHHTVVLDLASVEVERGVGAFVDRASAGGDDPGSEAWASSGRLDPSGDEEA